MNSLRKFLPLVLIAASVITFLFSPVDKIRLTTTKSSKAESSVGESWGRLEAEVDIDGRHVWAIVRCDAPQSQFGSECVDSDLDSVLKFDPDGNVVESLEPVCSYGHMV